MLNRLASLAMSTSVLEALPGKFYVKIQSPSITDYWMKGLVEIIYILYKQLWVQTDKYDLANVMCSKMLTYHQLPNHFIQFSCV